MSQVWLNGKVVEALMLVDLNGDPYVSAGGGGGGGLTDAEMRASAVAVADAVANVILNDQRTVLIALDNKIAATNALLEAVEALVTTLNGTIGTHNAPFVDGAVGQVVLGKRRDSDSTLVADGDLNTLNMDEEGRLKVSSKPASYPDITGNITAIQATIGTPVAGGTVEGDVSRASNVMAFCSGTFNTVNVAFEGSLESSGDSNWFSVQAIRSNANTPEVATGNLSAQPIYAWEASVNALKRFRVRCTARTSGTQSWRFVQGTYATEPIPASQVTGTQPVSGTVTANQGTLATPTALNFNSAATTNLTAVKASAGTLYNAVFRNTGAGSAFVKLYNKASAPVVASDVPVLVLEVPAAGLAQLNLGVLGHRFTTGIAMAVTGALADADATATTVGQVRGLISFI